MTNKRRMLAGAVAFAAALGTQLAGAPGAGAAEAVTLHYDSSGAPDYLAQIDQAAANWNAAVQNVKLERGGSATIIFHETHDGRGSHTNTDGHGHGDIYLDSKQVDEGNDVTRIAAHEVGHNLGLPDHYEGPCSELMSGHGPGTSCKNAKPDAQESAKVDENFANGLAAVVEQARRAVA
ncbi:snapalysin family zinc-dependent metalloprotease [Amycolatopsis anabasis]|uniref:snapalysin family zinc-dependent metalloprotease n=1 Tax=Amycolatopsis anabasis TaxID=1840409 RepID=UPI00131B7D25|nr:snapalysin family zinc-dependent metalloprotease [Amycolatopsis anabasis]